ncbi:MAG: hypothetical protein ACLQSR_13475 [Limisphaerales bacterium]
MKAMCGWNNDETAFGSGKRKTPQSRVLIINDIQEGAWKYLFTEYATLTGLSYSFPVWFYKYFTPPGLNRHAVWTASTTLTAPSARPICSNQAAKPEAPLGAAYSAIYCQKLRYARDRVCNSHILNDSTCNLFSTKGKLRNKVVSMNKIAPQCAVES